ncbi:kinase-like domain-containing protein [Xylaria digitata]|nr:kinase-like domain-containing protein [Xylaria digitata]
MAAAGPGDIVKQDETDPKNKNDDRDDRDYGNYDEAFYPLEISPKALCTWATSVRNRLIQSNEMNEQNNAPVECIKVLAAMSGSYNDVFPLLFSDNVCWALKVPQSAAQGTFDASAAHSLTSEAHTLLVLEKQTTIPVPHVYSVQPDPDNELQCPYILTNFINGKPLSEVWFDRSVPEDVLEKRRIQALQDLAQAMIQLGKFTFSQSGCPEFDSRGTISGVGPLRTWDIAASLLAQGIEDMEDYEDGADVMRDLGPFNNPTSYILSLFNRRKPPLDRFGRGIYKLLRLFIEWLSELDEYENGGFVLSHPDLGLQNILVAEDGKISGIIDWEGVAVVPKCLGNLRYPSFLTKGWEPAAYGYIPSGTAKNYKSQNSPGELQRFREAYCEMIGNLLGSTDAVGTKWTRRSLMIENLKIAADDPGSTNEIIERVFEGIKQSATQSLGIDEEDLRLSDIANQLAEGSIDEGTLEVIGSGFLHLCDSV